MIVATEVFYLLLMVQSVMLHVIILPLIYDSAGRDAWISALLSIPVGMGMIWVIYRLKLSVSNDFDKFATMAFGKYARAFLKTIFFLYFLYLASFSLASLLDLLHASFLPLSPPWALSLIFMICCLYLASKGYKIIALVATVLMYFAVLSGFVIGIFDSFNKDLGNLLPLLEFGWKPVGHGILDLSSIWAEMIFLLFIPVDLTKRKNIARACYWGVGVNGATMVLTIAGVLMIFGLGQTKFFHYPALEIVRFLTLGFVDRFDVYAEILMVFGALIRCGLYMRIACNQFFQESLRVAFRTGLFLTGLLLTIFALYMAQTHTMYVRWLGYYVYGIILLPLPFLIYGIGSLRNKVER